MTNLTPRQRRQQRTRTAILDSARSLINQGGIDALSMRKVAQEIDYSPAGLYEYFDSKEEIVFNLCEEADKNLGNYLNQVDSNLPHLERLIELGAAYIQFAKNNREQFLLLFVSGPAAMTSRLPESGQESSTINPQGSFTYLFNAVQDAVNDSYFPTSGPKVIELSYTLWAMVHGMAMLQLTALKPTGDDFEPVDRWALDRYIRGMAS